MQENCGKVGDVLVRGLQKLRDEYEVLGDVRGKGLMLGIELVKDKVIVFFLLTELYIYKLLCLVKHATKICFHFFRKHKILCLQRKFLKFGTT